MCEALIRVVDKTNADPYFDAQCTKRGDVIVVVPDGWSWGHEELINSDWRVLKLPNVSELQAASFLAPEPETNPKKPSRVLQRRAFKFDLDDANLPAELKAWLQDGARNQPTFAAALTGAQLNAFRKAKPKRSDPSTL